MILACQQQYSLHYIEAAPVVGLLGQPFNNALELTMLKTISAT